jgi:predicted Zn-dependent protease
MKKSGSYGKKIMAASLLAAAVWGVPLSAPVQAAGAGDAIAAAASALGIFGAYKSCLSSILSVGNEVEAQVQGWKQDIAKNNADKDGLDQKAVDDVMHRLTEQGSYVLKANSLPFLWAVNDSDMFNASCYPTDYISINRGLVKGLNRQPDEMAAVLGHEMTHGLEQHSAYNYAKAAAQAYGAMFLGIASKGDIDWNAMNALVDYSVSQNVTLPTEYEADAGGFRLMTSAGFNPGGGAAAMARMQYYFKYQTKNVWEYQDDSQPDFSDHPAEDLREKRLAAMLTAYSCGHVTVQDRQDVCIDGQLLIRAGMTATEYDNTAENAYLIAGGLAKAFHDQPAAAGWDFRRAANGRWLFLDETPAYGLLQDFMARGDNAVKLQAMVKAAYASASDAKGRAALQKQEKQHQDELAKRQQEVLKAKQKYVKQLCTNADRYSDYGMGEKALWEVERVFPCRNQDNMSENYAVRGRAKAVLGRYDEALSDANKAVAMDGKDIYNFLNRADVYRMKGDRPAALADCQRAQALDAKNPFVWKLAADIYNEMGDKDKALASYRKYNGTAPRARDIPEEYWKVIQPDIWAKEKAAQAEADKEKAKTEQAKPAPATPAKDIKKVQDQAAVAGAKTKEKQQTTVKKETTDVRSK